LLCSEVLINESVNVGEVHDACGYGETLKAQARRERTMSIERMTFWFLLSFAITLWSCLVGNDDIVYRFYDPDKPDEKWRKPTGKEGWGVIVFVFAKVVASLYGGGLIAAFVILKFIKHNPSENQALGLLLLFSAVAGLLIGVLQNVIRSLQGRTLRPVFDFALYKRNIKSHFRPRSG
jgi:hypothetical protein